MADSIAAEQEWAYGPLRPIDRIAVSIAKIVDGCQHKEPADLTEIEKVAIALFGGAEMEFIPTGVRVKHPFGLQKIDGRWIVCESRSRPGDRISGMGHRIYRDEQRNG